MIEANAVVLKDVPLGATTVGIPTSVRSRTGCLGGLRDHWVLATELGCAGLRFFWNRLGSSPTMTIKTT